MVASVVNAVLFQLVWTACVWGGGSGRWWLGPLAAAGFALWQTPQSPRPAVELRLVAWAVAVGVVMDSAFIAAGLLSYPHPGPWRLVAPIWILALWAGFALTLNHSLGWLHGRPVVAAVVGGVAGPFSYWVGASAWGAVELAAPTTVVVAVLAAAWAVVTPALVHLAGRLDRGVLPGPAAGAMAAVETAAAGDR